MCKKWAVETVDAANTKTKEEVEAMWLQEEVKPEPVRFNAQADRQRIQNIGKKGRKNGR